MSEVKLSWGGYGGVVSNAPSSPSAPSPMGNRCPVHGSERKTIGLFPKPGQTADECYAEWALARGEICTCIDKGER